MGLNWSAGLAGAASGMEGMVKLKEKEVGLLYDQVSQQNQFRHAKEMQKGNQEFLTGEREAGQQWKLENEIPLEQKKIEQQGRLAILQQQSLDTQRAIENRLREQANAISQQRADTTATSEQADTQMARERLLSEQKKLMDEKWEEKGDTDTFQWRALKKNNPQEYDRKLADLEREKADDYALASLLPSQQNHYIDAAKNLAGLKPEAQRDLAKKYATMSKEQRDRVWELVPEKATGQQFGEAIRQAMSRQEASAETAPSMAEPQSKGNQALFDKYKAYKSPDAEQEPQVVQQDVLTGAERI